jgi:hypothetical protein
VKGIVELHLHRSSLPSVQSRPRLRATRLRPGSATS